VGKQGGAHSDERRNQEPQV